MHRRWAQVAGGVMLAGAVMAGSLFFPTGKAAPLSAPQAEAATVKSNAGTSMNWMTLRIDGEVVQGDSTRKGRENMIEVLAFNQSVITAREAGSGMATGRRQYQPLLIRKRIDKASPLLMRSLAEQRPVEMTLYSFRTAPTGEEQRFYQISLSDAQVADIKIVQDGDQPPMEEVSFVFRTISWTHVPSQTVFQDSIQADQ